MPGGNSAALFLMRISEVFTSAKTSSVRRDVASARSLSGATNARPNARPNTTTVVAAVATTGVRVPVYLAQGGGQISLLR